MPFILRTLLLPVFVLLITGTAAGQHVCSADDTCDVVIITNIISDIPDTLPYDTTLRHFWQSRTFNTPLSFMALTGSSGHPGISLYRTFTPQEFDYFYHNPYSHYMADARSLKIIRSSIPWSEWFYLTGAHREQIFQATHAIEAGPGFNAGIDLKFVNNTGAYQNQHAKASAIAFYAQHRNPKYKFENDLLLFFNHAVTSENGGISDRSYFYDTIKINRLLAPVYLESAQNHLKNSSVILQNRYYTGNNQRLSNDSLSSTATTSSYAFLNLAIERYQWLYRDADPFNPWYFNTRYDTLVTHDTLSSTAYMADIGFKALLTKGMSGTMGIKLRQYYYYDTLNPTGKGHASSPYLHWHWSPAKALKISATAKLIFDPQWGTNHGLSLAVHWKTGNSTLLSLAARDWTDFPYRQDLHYASNHFFWINEFNNPRYTCLTSSVQFGKRFPSGVETNIVRLENLIYYNRQAVPAQFTLPFLFYQVKAFSRGVTGIFHYDVKIGWQKTADNTHILRQPELLGESMVGLSFSLFAKKIDGIAGMTIHGRTAAYADQWMPVTRIFYHTSLPALDAYLWADPFVSILIKKTRIKVSYDHATAWLAGFGYDSLPGYPMADPALKVSLAWRFMD